LSYLHRKCLWRVPLEFADALVDFLVDFEPEIIHGDLKAARLNFFFRSYIEYIV
jgi:hypothetical protein